MVAWKPRPFIFVHIPKCAGASIERALATFATGKKDFSRLTEKDLARFWLPGQAGLQHSELRDYARDFPLPEYFKFAFVRNPWDRAVSQIEFLRKRHVPLFASPNFKKNLRVYCATTATVRKHNLGACQADYLCDGTGRVAMNFIGRFESLREDFETVCAALGLKRAPELPHFQNSKRTRNYSAYYDDESAEWVRRRFAKDIDYFGYKFEPADSLPRRQK